MLRNGLFCLVPTDTTEAVTVQQLRTTLIPNLQTKLALDLVLDSLMSIGSASSLSSKILGSRYHARSHVYVYRSRKRYIDV